MQPHDSPQRHETQAHLGVGAGRYHRLLAHVALRAVVDEGMLSHPQCFYSPSVQRKDFLLEWHFARATFEVGTLGR